MTRTPCPSQTAVYQFEGSVNKFLLDDKGSTLIAVFGLPPFSHENDATRATLCSITLLARLQSLLKLTASIGVTTGAAFCGVLGSQTRKEYSVLGDSVNLSARLMQARHATSLPRHASSCFIAHPLRAARAGLGEGGGREDCLADNDSHNSTACRPR